MENIKVLTKQKQKRKRKSWMLNAFITVLVFSKLVQIQTKLGVTSCFERWWPARKFAGTRPRQTMRIFLSLLWSGFEVIRATKCSETSKRRRCSGNERRNLGSSMAVSLILERSDTGKPKLHWKLWLFPTVSEPRYQQNLADGSWQT